MPNLIALFNHTLTDAWEKDARASLGEPKGSGQGLAIHSPDAVSRCFR